MRDKLIPTTGHNQCPLCSDHTGDCRISGDTMILCHGYIDQDSPLYGWKWTKTSANGVWGVHVVDDGKEFDREQWERDKFLRQQQQQDKLKFLGENALPISGRDKAYRKLSDYLGLSDHHKKKLEKRGLTESQIDEIPFFSVNQYSPILVGTPDNLPGIGTNYQTGDLKFCVSDSGYFCPSFDIKGKVNGGQVRYETANNKYRWLKGVYSSHLPNGELPLTLVKGKTESDTLYLTEGILKPLITSKKFDINVCGAAGGHFKSSPNQFKEILTHYQTIILCPDAGDVLNGNVMNRWESQVNFIKSLGYGDCLKVLWWQQVIKESSDIDEIDKHRFNKKAKLITFDEFLDIANREQYLQRCWDSYQEVKTFTPSQTVNQQYLDLPKPAPNTITFIKSGLGTGKTTNLLKWLETEEDKGVFFAGYRNSLLIQTAEKGKHLNLYHIHEDDAELMMLDDNARILACVNSLLKFPEHFFDDKILVIDEVCSVIKHLLNSPTVKRRDEILERFRQALIHANRVICLDGTLSDWVKDFLSPICPDKTVIAIENTYKDGKPTINYLEGIEVFEQVKVSDGFIIKSRIKRNDRSPWLERVLMGDKIAVCSDSQVFLETLEEVLKSQGLQGIRIDSKTSSKCQEFLVNPDNWISQNKPNYVLYSPSAESGLDIAIKDYFNCIFGFFFGAIDIDSMTQMIARGRDPKPERFVWCKEFVPVSATESASPFVDILNSRLNQAIERDMKLLMSGEIKGSMITSKILEEILNSMKDAYDCALKIQSFQNYEKGNLRKCLKAVLENSGYVVKSHTLSMDKANPEINKTMKDTKEQVQIKEASEIFSASDQFIGKKDLQAPFDADWPVKCAIEKARIIDLLPGINKAEVWSEDFILETRVKDRGFIEKNRRFYLLNHLDIAKEYSKDFYSQILKKIVKGANLTVWRFKQEYALLKSLEDIGILDYICNPEPLNKDSERLKQIINKAKQKRHRDALKRSPGKDPIKYFKSLLAIVGVDLTSFRTGDDCQRIRFYTLDTDKFNHPYRLATLESLQDKFTTWTASRQPIDWEFELNRLESQKTPESEVSGEVNLKAPKVPETIPPYSFPAVQIDDHFFKEKYCNVDGENDTNLESLKPLDKPLDEPDEQMFWWGKLKARFDQEFELKAHQVYYQFLGLNSSQEWQNIKDRVRELSLSLGWAAGKLARWVFKNMPDEDRDRVRDFLQAA